MKQPEISAWLFAPSFTHVRVYNSESDETTEELQLQDSTEGAF